MMMDAVEIERWRSYFGKAGVDIWTVIQHAINIAAIDYPMDFRDRRGEIAETLFARNLLMINARAINHDSAKLISSEGPDDLRDCDARRAWQSASAKRLAQDGNPHGIATHAKCHIIHANNGDPAHESLHSNPHQEAEPLPDEPEKDTLLILIRDIKVIKAVITDEDQPENVVVEALQRLQYMEITVEALRETEIGKQVKILKKHPSKRVRALVKELVRNWKVIVDEWAKSTVDGIPAAVPVNVTETRDCPEAQIQEERSPSPLLIDDCAHVEAGVPDVDLSKLFSFMDGKFCTEDKDSHRHCTSVEPSVKDNLTYLSRSQSGSMLTDSSDFDTKASTNHPWGHRTPEERGSVTRDVYPPPGKFEREGLASRGQAGQHDKTHRNRSGGWAAPQSSKGTTNGADPGQQCGDVPKVKLTSDGRQAQANKHDVNRTHTNHKSAVQHSSGADKPSLLKSDKSQIDRKLEIAKRKLHQGYQQAENAKKQRIVQVLDFPEGAKAGQPVKGKVNPPVQSKGIPPAQKKTGFQNGHRSQKGRP